MYTRKNDYQKLGVQLSPEVTSLLETFEKEEKNLITNQRLLGKKVSFNEKTTVLPLEVAEFVDRDGNLQIAFPNFSKPTLSNKEPTLLMMAKIED